MRDVTKMLSLILEINQLYLWKSYTLDRKGVFWAPYKDLCTSLIHAEKWKGRKKGNLTTTKKWLVKPKRNSSKKVAVWSVRNYYSNLKVYLQVDILLWAVK